MVRLQNRFRVLHSPILSDLGWNLTRHWQVLMKEAPSLRRRVLPGRPAPNPRDCPSAGPVWLPARWSDYQASAPSFTSVRACFNVTKEVEETVETTRRVSTRKIKLSLPRVDPGTGEELDPPEVVKVVAHLSAEEIDRAKQGLLDSVEAWRLVRESADSDGHPIPRYEPAV